MTILKFHIAKHSERGPLKQETAKQGTLVFSRIGENWPLRLPKCVF